jgi:hypothetical protein
LKADVALHNDVVAHGHGSVVSSFDLRMLGVLAAGVVISDHLFQVFLDLIAPVA